MRARSLVFAVLGAAFVLGAAAPAYADRDDRRHEEHHDRNWHGNWHGRPDWNGAYYAPPVVVGPPAYYAPPPVVYSPGVTFGLTIR